MVGSLEVFYLGKAAQTLTNLVHAVRFRYFDSIHFNRELIFMPIYEFQCENCDYVLEVIQKVSDPPPSHCPACNSLKLRKKVSTVAFRLAGGGWYETDFKTGEKKNLVADAEKKSNSSSETSSGSMSEKKIVEGGASDKAISKGDSKKDGSLSNTKKGDSS